MSKREEHHVTYNSKLGVWDVKRSGASRVSFRADTKRESVSEGRKISNNAQTELAVHLKSGKFQQLDSHGNDPCPPVDKK